MAENSAVRAFFEKQGPSHPLVRQFIAGASLREALLVVKELQDENIHATIDILGENVLLPEEAERSTQAYLESIRQISIFCPGTHISVKLTSLGLDISEQLARENLHRLTHEAIARGGIYVRVDMEGSSYTARTHRIVVEEHRIYPKLGGVVQARLRRSDRDLELLLKEKVPIRLVKGAYQEPAEIAYTKKADIDHAYRKLMYVLLEKGQGPSIATHDEQILTVAKKFVKQQNIAPDRFEFEMLLGVRKDLQTSLAKEGFSVRVYVPFGASWYPYFSRRLSEKQGSLGGLVLKKLMQ